MPTKVDPLRDEDIVARVVAGRIIARRQYLGLKQTEVAARLGVPEGSYGRWETGRVRFSAPALIAIADALRVPVSYLFGEYDGGIGPEEAEVIQTWRALPASSRRVARATLQALMAEHFGHALEGRPVNVIGEPDDVRNAQGVPEPNRAA